MDLGGGLRLMEDGSRYEGEYKNGKRDGRGVQTWPDKARYEGTFRDGERSGYGVFTWPNGNRYEGTFKDGKKAGNGTFTWADKSKYVGAYKNGQRHGPGIFYHGNKKVEFCVVESAQENQVWSEGRLVKRLPISDPDLAHNPMVGELSGTGRMANFNLRLARKLTAAIPPVSVPAEPSVLSADRPRDRPLLAPSGVQSVPRSAAPTVNAGKRWTDPGSGITFATIPGGCFFMGSDQGSENEQPRHEVCLRPFAMGIHEVTQGQWRRVMGSLPSQSQMGDDLPVESVTWDDTEKFVRTLNLKSSTHFRLPSEAEWEYACKSGGADTGPFCGGDDLKEIGWYYENSGNRVHPVGQLKSNLFGVYDMTGNVWEWVDDWYVPNYYQKSPKQNPTGPISGSSRIMRGGAWLSKENVLRATIRYDLAPDRGYQLLGFRLATRDHPRGEDSK